MCCGAPGASKSPQTTPTPRPIRWARFCCADMAVSFNPPSQPGGNQLNPVTIWVQNLIDSLKAAFAQVNLIRPVIPPVVFETGAVATGTNGNMPGTADTVPTNTMGDQFMSLAYTPQNAGS